MSSLNTTSLMGASQFSAQHSKKQSPLSKLALGLGAAVIASQLHGTAHANKAPHGDSVSFSHQGNPSTQITHPKSEMKLAQVLEPKQGQSFNMSDCNGMSDYDWNMCMRGLINQIGRENSAAHRALDAHENAPQVTPGNEDISNSVRQAYGECVTGLMYENNKQPIANQAPANVITQYCMDEVNKLFAPTQQP
jgi:hypothetical protein